MEYGHFRAMGSEISWWGTRDLSRDLAAHFERVEACCSRFRQDSELSRINSALALSVPISPLMAEMLKTADSANRLSEGRVDPTVLAAVRSAGYDRDLAMAAKVNRGPRSVPGWDSIEFNETSVRRPPGVGIDLGGIAKGWTSRAALEIPGARLIDAAGDVAARGRWVIDVVHNGERVAGLTVEDCGVATSGIDRRRWTNGHHLIDPSTGAPAETDVLAATVVAEDVTVAETVARSMVLMGAWEGLGWSESLPAVRGALVTTTEGMTLSFPRTQEVLS